MTQSTFFSDGADGSSTFSYDATGQLIEADHTAQADEEFEFDENGNRTMTGYDTGSNNLLLSDGTFDYVYDNEGNRVSRTRISNDPADDKTVEYEWDYRNRLTRVVFKDNSGDVTKEVIYEYDVFNRRITKIIDADGEGVGVAEQTDFIYDGQDIVLALDGEGSLTNRYLHGPAIDQILADEQIDEEQLLWLLADNLGSVRDLVNNAGEVESHIDYTAFGAVETITNNLVQTLYGFTGRERDAETGLTYHRARYYDPLVGRWLSEDPIAFSAGDANIQRYVGNDPVNYVDPYGLAGDSVKAAEGRVKGAAIEESYVDSGDYRRQAAVKNKNDSSGVVDLESRKPGPNYEVGPGSKTGVPAKNAQAAKRVAETHVIVYRQQGKVPCKGDTIEYVVLTPDQSRRIQDAIKSKEISTSDEIWEAAKDLGEVRTAKVSEAAAKQAGRHFAHTADDVRKLNEARRRANDVRQGRRLAQKGMSGIPFVPDPIDFVFIVYDTINTPYDESTNCLFGPHIDSGIESTLDTIFILGLPAPRNWVSVPNTTKLNSSSDADFPHGDPLMPRELETGPVRIVQ